MMETATVTSVTTEPGEGTLESVPSLFAGTQDIASGLACLIIGEWLFVRGLDTLSAHMRRKRDKSTVPAAVTPEPNAELDSESE